MAHSHALAPCWVQSQAAIHCHLHRPGMLRKERLWVGQLDMYPSTLGIGLYAALQPSS